MPLANALFDVRAAAVVLSSAGPNVTVEPPDPLLSAPGALLERKVYGDKAPPIWVLTPSCLAAMAYLDYFPDQQRGIELRSKVSQAIMEANPGWCGSFGPGTDGAFSLGDGYEGNYDMNEMHLLPLIYRYYDELTAPARDKLLMELLNLGRIHRPDDLDSFTSGYTPNDWSRAGYVSPAGFHYDIPETENHDLMILTARYLVNQLLYQRLHDNVHDNRRNGDPGNGRSDCMELLLLLLQNMLRDDFAEYNAKTYQEETRYALLNLSDFAYDSEVRLAARMVLDYISARMAVSSSDLRRLVPFRRRNEEPKNHLLSADIASKDYGFMDVQLSAFLAGGSADPMAPYFALLAGNTRAFEVGEASRPWQWGINPHPEYAIQALSDYRLPPSIHDLFVNDLHRRFFQRLHRFVDPRAANGDHLEQQRNCDNMEIYAGSPSYLISAGGRPATWVIPGHDTPLGRKGFQDQNIGVAVPTSFMPTGMTSGSGIAQSSNLIQFSHFSDLWDNSPTGFDGETENYGVAPDFACGYKVHIPQWVWDSADPPVAHDAINIFVNRGSIDPLTQQPRQINGRTELAGFYLFIHRDGDFALMEAFDTWLRPDVSFSEFKAHVLNANPGISLLNNKETDYTTYNGNQVSFVIWNNDDQDHHRFGSRITRIIYGPGDPKYTLIDAGNDADSFLYGTVLVSPASGVIQIKNAALGATITLDMSNPLYPKRTSESGETEEAGGNHEVWVDFAWTGPFEGDFYRPFNTLTDAALRVAEGGTIKIMNGVSNEKLVLPVPPLLILNPPKRFTVRAVPGPVTLGRQ